MLTTIILAAVLQVSPQTLMERAWTCEIMRDLVQAAEARFGDDPPEIFALSSEFSTPHRPVTFEEFLGSLNERCELDMCGLLVFPEWRSAFEDLPFGAVQSAWQNYTSGGTLVCEELADRNWSTPEDARTNYDRLMRDRLVRAHVPPNHPDHLPVSDSTCGPLGEGIPRMIFVQISRPAFDPVTRRAFFMQRGGGVIMQRLHSGRWVRRAASNSQFAVC